MIHAIEFRVMGCEAHIQLASESQQAADDLQQAVQRLMTYEAILTRFNPDSELMQLNQQSGTWVHVSSVLFDNIHAAKHAARMTHGRYNPLVGATLTALGYDNSFEQLVPQNTQVASIANWREIQLDITEQRVCIPHGAMLDLGGIAKGWAAETIADDLATHGACLVNIGGDMAAHGKPDGYDGWPVQLCDPSDGAPFTTIMLHNRSVATSGIDYRHWQDTTGHTHHHIIDPQTGQSARTDVVSVSVIHRHATMAEAFTKAVLLQGATDGLNWLNQQWEGDGLVFSRDGAVLATDSLSHTF